MRVIIRRLAVIAFGAAVGGCSHGEQSGPAGQGGRIPDVAVVTIVPQRAVLTAELPGRTSPFAVSDVRPQVTGILKARLFIEGSQVQAGAAAVSDRRDAAPGRVRRGESATREREGGADDGAAESRAFHGAAQGQDDQRAG